MSMEKRLRAYIFALGAVFITVAIVISSSVFGYALRDKEEEALRTDARVLCAAYNKGDSLADLKGALDENTRVTLVSPKGEVLYESDISQSKMENHLDRPEIKAALRVGEGVALRRSDTQNADVYYAALRTQNGNILRVSKQTANINAALGRLVPMLIILCVLLIALAAAGAYFLTKSVVRPLKILAEDINAQEKIDDEILPFVRQIRSQSESLKNRSEQLENEKNRLSAVIESMSEALLVLDSNRSVTLMNAAAHALLGFDTAKDINILRLTRNKAMLECLDDAYKEGSGAREMVRGARTLQLHARRTSGGGVICVALDITERAQLDTMRAEFTANVSHELKTPLTSISGYAELLMNNLVRDEDRENFARRIYTEASRLISLVEDIITVSALDEGKSEEFTAVDLTEVAKRTVASLESKAQGAHVRLWWEGVPSCVTGSDKMLTQLLYNLTDNAIRYNRSGGEVQITVGENSLAVRDSGIGIPSDAIDRIFERFYRVDKSRSKDTGGTGLGLAIVKHIVKMHGAAINVQSTEGVGTLIEVKFHV